MYESFYGFKDTPFRLSADEKFCFAHSQYEKTFACVASSLEEGRCIVLLTGLPGCGKTVLCRDVISKLDPDKYVAINIMLSQLSSEELFRKIALELGIPAEEYDNTALLSSINEYMTALYRMGRKVIVFLDETHKLITNDFTELRLLSALQDEQNPVLQIVLIGNQALSEAFFESGIERFSEKTVSACELKCMTVEQTRSYIRHRFLCVGWRGDPVIDRTVFSIIYDITQGVARLINLVMTQLLLYSAFEAKHKIGVDDLLVVIQMMINEDRLTLDSDETVDSIKERYKSIEQNQSHSVSQDKSYSEQEIKQKTGQPGRPLSDHLSQFDDIPSLIESTRRDIEDAGESDETYFLSDDEDMPDTDWLEWDGADPDRPVSKAMQQSNSVSRRRPGTGFEQMVKNKGNDLKRSENEHQWGGVWWMSENVKGRMRVCPAVSDELPSIEIDGCPDLLTGDAPEWLKHQKRVAGLGGLKPNLIAVAVIVTSALLFLLLFQFITW